MNPVALGALLALIFGVLMAAAFLYTQLQKDLKMQAASLATQLSPNELVEGRRPATRENWVDVSQYNGNASEEVGVVLNEIKQARKSQKAVRQQDWQPLQGTPGVSVPPESERREVVPNEQRKSSLMATLFTNSRLARMRKKPIVPTDTKFSDREFRKLLASYYGHYAPGMRLDEIELAASHYSADAESRKELDIQLRSQNGVGLDDFFLQNLEQDGEEPASVSVPMPPLDLVSALEMRHCRPATVLTLEANGIRTLDDLAGLDKADIDVLLDDPVERNKVASVLSGF